MKRCTRCGEKSDLPFRCSYCDLVYCESHRMPEAHDCDGVRFLSDPGKRFESKFSGEIVREGKGIRAPEPIEPEYTVGTTPDEELESSPAVEVKDADRSASSRSGILEWIRGLFG